MLKNKILPPLIALAALMLVVSGTLAAVLLSGDDEDEDPPSAQGSLSTATATIEATAAGVLSTAQPTATSTAHEIPSNLRARFDALPEKLRNETLQAYQDGTLDDEQLETIISDYENRNPGVRVGSVVSTGDDGFEMEVYTTGERVAITVDGETVIRRAQRDIAVVDLQPDELVMVLHQDGRDAAFSVEAFGVSAP